MRHQGHWVSRSAVLAAATFALAQPAAADWWSETFEVHGFARSTASFNSPSFDFSDALQLDSFRTELNLEVTADLYSGDDLSISAFAVLRPSYDAVYDLYPDLYGKRARGGDFGSETGFGNLAGARESQRGNSFPGQGAGVNQQFRLVNGDIARVLTGQNNPAVIIDDEAFFGSRVAPFTPRSRRVPDIGGAPSLEGFDVALRSLQELSAQGLAPANITSNPNFVALQQSLNMAMGGAGANPALRDAVLAAGVTSPNRIEAGLGALGDRGSFKQAPFGVNDRQSQLATDCFDNAHPYCFLREFYFDIEYKNTLFRIGKQQIVWGKADNFRLQDIVNPLDLGQQSIFVPLEDQRIPTLALDMITSLGDVGPFQDVSLELVWVFDRFLPIQVGQCGDPRAFVIACEGRTDAASNTAIGLNLVGVEERDWQLRNTEPGFRIEWLLPDPQISFSVSGFLGFQDIPVARQINQFSASNPNPSALLLLQALGALQGNPNQAVAPFDPFDPASIRAAGAGLAATYTALADIICGAATATDAAALASCIGGNNQGFAPLGIAPNFQINQLLLPLSGGQVQLEYPRVFTLGFSADYQIPNQDAILRFEMAYDFNRKVQDVGEADLVDESNVISAVIGVDINPFIPFLNPNRTSFLSGQLFVEHYINYDDDGQGRRFIPEQTSAIATLFMQNFFRNDGVILTSFLAYDVGAQALAFGPTLKWILSERVFFEVGANIVNSKRQKRPTKTLCATGDPEVACLRDPFLQVPGNIQATSLGLRRSLEGPFFGERSFGDRFAENRDEIFFSLTYQF